MNIMKRVSINLKRCFCKHRGSVNKYNCGSKWVAVYECKDCGYKKLL